MITLADLHWTAGVFEAKGSFRTAAASSCNERPIIKFNQKRVGVIHRLHRLYGGGIYENPDGSVTWCLIGSRAIAVALTLYSLVSDQRRAEIERMVGNWRATKYRKTVSRELWGYRHATEQNDGCRPS